jgi:NADPH:quinone reductase-like Zn-dependent oxidoreductase
MTATTAQETTMKAIVQDTYGAAEVLELRDIDRPVPADDEVLVRVHAGGLDRGVWHVMTGLPYLIRVVVPTLGLRRPKVPVRGMDLAGRVEAVGSKVTRFKPGDAVFGWTDGGSYAEYTTAPEDHLAHKPANVSFEQAAAVPISGLAALQGLRDVGEIQPGQKVLVIGAAGGVGSFAVQLAKAFGAHVTGVAGTTQLELVRSIGADAVIDYTRDDVTDGTCHWDLILDTAGHRSLSRLRRALTPPGNPGDRRQRRTRALDGRLRPPAAGAGAVTVGGPAAADAELQAAAGGPPDPCGSSSRPARSPPSSTGPTRWSRSPRPSATWSRATAAPARSSSPCERPRDRKGGDPARLCRGSSTLRSSTRSSGAASAPHCSMRARTPLTLSLVCDMLVKRR